MNLVSVQSWTPGPYKQGYVQVLSLVMVPVSLQVTWLQSEDSAGSCQESHLGSPSQPPTVWATTSTLCCLRGPDFYKKPRSTLRAQLWLPFHEEEGSGLQRFERPCRWLAKEQGDVSSQCKAGVWIQNVFAAVSAARQLVPNSS